MAHTRQRLSRSSAVELGRAAAAGADDVLSAAPFVGDRLMARAVEEFVEAVAARSGHAGHAGGAGVGPRHGCVPPLMPGHDLPSVVALGGALQSLAGRFDAARVPQLMHSEPACPAALRPDATALVDAVGSLRPVLDAGGRALTSWTYAVARLDREQAAIEADAAARRLAKGQ